MCIILGFVILVLIGFLLIFIYKNNLKEDRVCITQIDDKIKKDIDNALSCQDDMPCPKGISCTKKCWECPITFTLLLANNLIQLKSGKKCGIVLGIKNILKNQSKIDYEIYVSQIVKTCLDIDKNKAQSYIDKRFDSIKLNPDANSYNLILINIPPKTSPCVIRYGINITADSKVYTSQFFDIFIKKCYILSIFP